MAQFELDPIDRKIINEQRKNGRRSNAEIAKNVGCSEATVRRRINRLLETGTERVIVAVNPLKMGLQFEVIFGLRAEPGKAEYIGEELAKLQEVNYVGLVYGGYDLFFQVYFESNDAILEFLREKVLVLPGIRDCQPYHVLKVVKRSYQWIQPDDQAGRAVVPKESS